MLNLHMHFLGIILLLVLSSTTSFAQTIEQDPISAHLKMLGRGIESKDLKEAVVLSCQNDECSLIRLVLVKVHASPRWLGSAFPAGKLAQVRDRLKEWYSDRFIENIFNELNAESIYSFHNREGWNWSEKPVSLSAEEYSRVISSMLYFAEYQYASYVANADRSRPENYPPVGRAIRDKGSKEKIDFACIQVGTDGAWCDQIQLRLWDSRGVFLVGPKIKLTRLTPEEYTMISSRYFESEYETLKYKQERKQWRNRLDYEFYLPVLGYLFESGSEAAPVVMLGAGAYLFLGGMQFWGIAAAGILPAIDIGYNLATGIPYLAVGAAVGVQRGVHSIQRRLHKQSQKRPKRKIDRAIQELFDHAEIDRRGLKLKHNHFTILKEHVLGI